MRSTLVVAIAGLCLVGSVHAETAARSPLDRPFQDDWCDFNGVWEPAWSPDGSSIAFASDHSGGSHVWAMPAGGGDPVQITQGPGEETAPAWSPRGDRIAYLATDGRCSWIGIESNLRVVSVEPRSWSFMKALYR